mgnify:FL=1
MESFEYYLENGLIKKSGPNKERAMALINDAHDRIKDALSLDAKKFPKIVFEQIYDALRDFCDAILFIDGFKPYSHEATISYLIKNLWKFLKL